MIKQISSTTASRLLITLSGLGVLLLNTRFLGAEKIGELAIYLICINLILHVSEIVGGPSMVYLQKKYTTKGILSFAYLWALFTCIVALFALSMFSDFGTTIYLLILLSSFIQSMAHANLHMLVGKKKINQYNTSTFLSAIIILVGLAYSYLTLHEINVKQFLLVYTLGQILSFLLSLYYLSHELKLDPIQTNLQSMYKELFNFGLVIQLANLFQFGVYRSNYLILESFASTGILGVYSIGNQVGEKALIPGKAVSLVQYSAISNSDDLQYASKLTIQLANLNTVLSVISFSVLLCVPSHWLTYLLGPDFNEIKLVLFYLAPGIVFLSISSAFSHFFSGLGKYSINTKISALGFFLILIFSFLTIPKYGIIGAAISASGVYFAQLIINIVVFKSVAFLNWSMITTIYFQSFKKYSFKYFWNQISK